MTALLVLEQRPESGIDVGKFIRTDREDYLTHIVYVSSREVQMQISFF